MPTGPSARCFWLTALPFVTAPDARTAITATVALIMTNVIYYGRAKMEEKHLAEDPVYVQYALAMNERSILRGVARVLPFLRFRAPDEPSPPPPRDAGWRVSPSAAE